MGPFTEMIKAGEAGLSENEELRTAVLFEMCMFSLACLLDIRLGMCRRHLNILIWRPGGKLKLEL